MMLTPVTEAKSASDQFRASRKPRIAAPADSRLTAALRPYSDTTQAYALAWAYMFCYRFSCHMVPVMYMFSYTFRQKEAVP